MAAHEEKMASARAMVIFKAPYFAQAVHGFVYQAVPGIKTMLVTQKLVLGYDPQWGDEATIAHLASDIFHEVNHFVRQHFERALHVDDPELWNLAGDCAINQDMRIAGWDCHESYVYPEMFDLPLGKSTEEYYDLLKQLKASGKLRKQKPKPGQGPGQPGQSGQPQPGQPPPSGEQQAQLSEGLGSGQCGGLGGHSNHKDIEAELNNEPGLGRSAEEVTGIEQRVQADIKAHAESAKGRGTMPASLLELLKKFEEPSCVRWQDELAHVLRDATGRVQSGGDDFSRARPNKRSIMRGVVRPSMVEYLPEVCFIRDSSGSMGAPQLTDAAREGYAVMQALGIDEVWFGDADTKMSMPWKRVGASFFRSLTEAHGRGGTTFIQPLEAAQKLTPQPDLLVYFTDGDGVAPRNPPPGIAVVWCVVPSAYNRKPANWGHLVVISNDPRVRNKKMNPAIVPGLHKPDDD